MNSHIKTAHAWGVEQALSQAGYSSYDALVKEAEALGLVEKTAFGPLAGALGGGAIGAGGGALAAHLLGAPMLASTLGTGALGALVGGAIGAHDPYEREKAIAAGAGKGALVGAVPGAITGATLADEGERLRGALKGGLIGSSLGAVGGGLVRGAGHSLERLQDTADAIHMNQILDRRF